MLVYIVSVMVRGEIIALVLLNQLFSFKAMAASDTERVCGS